MTYQWLFKAANRGDSAAMIRVGCMYIRVAIAWDQRTDLLNTMASKLAQVDSSIQEDDELLDPGIAWVRKAAATGAFPGLMGSLSALASP